MGWIFHVKHASSLGDGSLTYLMCYKRLFNPEIRGEVYSQSNFHIGDYDRSIYRALPQRFYERKMKECAAWLIAHWWEHYLNICPCLKGDTAHEEISQFRKTMMESLLWYDKNV